MTCETCRWWDVGVYDKGECHRHAPKAVGAWPVTLSRDWCGDYEAKEQVVVIRGGDDAA
jgi:hypothetical protein